MASPKSQPYRTLSNVPCCYEDEGCKYVLPPSQIDDHQLECKNRRFSCEGTRFCGWSCGWTGQFFDIPDHFSDEHVRHCSMKYSTQTTMKIDLAVDFKDLQLISFHDGNQLFYCKHKMDADAQKAYWIFQYVGPLKQAGYYEYEFEVRDGPVRKFKVNDYCTNDTVDVDKMFREGKCVAMPFKTLRKYVNDDGELNFRFRIQNVNSKSN